MSKRPTFKFMVASGNRRSALWTVYINKSDVYISSSISKQDKISLHESGSYQWSLRSEALDNAPYVPETGRHLARWANPKVSAGDFTQNFFVLIAESELREDHKVPQKNVLLLPTPAAGFAAQVGFYFFENPTGGSLINIDPPPLFSHQLQDGRILLLAHQTIPAGENMAQILQTVHRAARVAAKRDGVDNPQAVVRITAANGVSGIMEVASRPELMIFASPEDDLPAPHWIPNRTEKIR